MEVRIEANTYVAPKMHKFESLRARIALLAVEMAKLIYLLEKTISVTAAATQIIKLTKQVVLDADRKMYLASISAKRAILWDNSPRDRGLVAQTFSIVRCMPLQVRNPTREFWPNAKANYKKNELISSKDSLCRLARKRVLQRHLRTLKEYLKTSPRMRLK